MLICVDSKSVIYALHKWDCKISLETVHAVKYLIHCIRSRGTGTEYCWVPSHSSLYWNEISDTLRRQGATATCLTYKITYLYYNLIISWAFPNTWKDCIDKKHNNNNNNNNNNKKQLQKCAYFLCPKYSTRVLSVCLSLSRIHRTLIIQRMWHVLLFFFRNPISKQRTTRMPHVTTEMFMKDGYDFSACNCDIVRDILKTTTDNL